MTRAGSGDDRPAGPRWPGRLPGIGIDQADAGQQAALAEWLADRGASAQPPGPIWSMLLHSPEGMRRVAKWGAFARYGTSLPEQEREAAIFVAACRCRFGYETRVHAGNLERLGVPPVTIEALRSGQFEDLAPAMRSAAQLACAMTGSTPEVTEECFTAARDLFGERGVVELGLVIAYYSALAKLWHLLAGGDG
jgi:4-carboxymuconolactone decarboxylase